MADLAFPWIQYRTAAYDLSTLVTGVAAKAYDECNNPTGLPRARVTWDDVAPAGGETWSAWVVYRRMADESQWTRLAVITDRATRTFLDWTAKGHMGIAYAVTWRADVGGGAIAESSRSLPAQLVLEFDYLYLHVFDHPEIWLKFPSFSANVDDVQANRVSVAWGSNRPNVQFGESFFSRISVPARPLMVNDWQWIQTLRRMRESYQLDSPIVARFGRSTERYFVAILSAPREMGQKQFTARMELVEVDFTEGVSS